MSGADGKALENAGPHAASPWSLLRRYTPARIALGRVGAGLPTAEVLDFAMRHARARDAVHAAFDAERLAAALAQEGLLSIQVSSRASARAEYLRRPDLGRLLREQDLSALSSADAHGDAHRLTIVIADGLSAIAPMRHALPFLAAFRSRLALRSAQADRGWDLDTIILARQARVALGDPIGQARGAEAVVVMLGERPGLSSPDSLGIYVTYAPRPGRTDAERNCISNVRPEGISYEQAAHTLEFLLAEARARGGSGIAIKDTTEWRPNLLAT